MKDKFVRKYMRMAREVGQDQPICYSRQIGTVLIDPVRNAILSTGYNGPPRETPHTDTREYLEKYFWPQLTMVDKWKLSADFLPADYEAEREEYDYLLKNNFLEKAEGCKTCPRKFVGAKSGERLELCSCSHSERNAIDNAPCDLTGAYAFCWCCVPCIDCCKAIINNRIKKVFCLEQADYHKVSRQLLAWSRVELVVLKEEWVDEETS